MSTHELKCWPQFFKPLAAGRKTFEKRKADRDYKLGDYLLLREWDPAVSAYTGDRLQVGPITYILEQDGAFGEEGWVTMAFPAPSRGAEGLAPGVEVHAPFVHVVYKDGTWKTVDAAKVWEYADAPDLLVCIPEFQVTPAPAPLVDAGKDVLSERERQKNVEGWSEAHDNEHAKGEMALAAACYALQFALPKPGPNKLWPWDSKWWKPKSPRRDLVRAGALILAEIERLDRLAPEVTP